VPDFNFLIPGTEDERPWLLHPFATVLKDRPMGEQALLEAISRHLR
jgi:hypothetical protein